ncbi:MAG: arylamine N-acetyltransferase [Gemmataceae bacterium]
MPLDLDAYLERLDCKDDPQPNTQTLHALHLAHATHIPFENLDVLLGRPVRLDLDSLQAKLVRGRRGGYCFEHNTLFAAALERIGFRVDRLAARVRYRAQGVLPRTHMLLRVEIEGRSWMCDVGFGGEGLLLPMPMAVGVECRQFLWTYRLVQEPGYWVWQSRAGEGWHDLHAFTLEPHHPVDFEMANWFVSTHPTSIFRRMLTAQRPTPEGRHVIRDREYTLDRGATKEVIQIADEEALLRLMRERIGLAFPAGTRFPIPEVD